MDLIWKSTEIDLQYLISPSTEIVLQYLEIEHLENAVLYFLLAFGFYFSNKFEDFSI